MFNNCTCEAFIVRLGLKPRLVSAKDFQNRLKEAMFLSVPNKKGHRALLFVWIQNKCFFALNCKPTSYLLSFEGENSPKRFQKMGCPSVFEEQIPFILQVQSDVYDSDDL